MLAELKALVNSPELEDVGPVLRAATSSDRGVGLWAAAVIRAAVGRGCVDAVRQLEAQADPGAPQAGLFAATLRVAGKDTSEREAVEACAAAWTPQAPRSDLWTTRDAEVLISALHHPRKRDDARAAVAARAQDPDLLDAMRQNLEPRLRGRAAKAQRDALFDVRGLGRAGMFVPVTEAIERLLSAKAASTREAAGDALDALAACDPAEVDADALPALLHEDVAAGSYAARWASVAVRRFARSGGLRGPLDPRLLTAHPGAVVEHALGFDDGDALVAVYEAVDSAEVVFAEIQTCFRRRRCDPADTPAALGRVLAREVDRVGALDGAALLVLLWAAPHHDIEEAVPWLAARARDTTPGRLMGTWLAWSGGKTTWSEIATRALGRLAQRPGASAAQAALDALLSEKKKAVASTAGRVAAIVAAVSSDWERLEALVRHRSAAVREGAYWGLAHGARSYGDELGSRTRDALAQVVPPSLLGVGVRDRSKAVREQALDAVRAAGVVLDALPEPEIGELATALRAGSYDAVRQAQARVVSWCERGHAPAHLAGLVAPLGDSAVVGPSIGPAVAALFDRGVDVQPLVPLLVGTVFADPVPTETVDALRRLVPRYDTQAADPYVTALLGHPERARAVHVAALRYLEARGASFRVPAWVLEDDSLGALAVSLTEEYGQ